MWGNFVPISGLSTFVDFLEVVSESSQTSLDLPPLVGGVNDIAYKWSERSLIPANIDTANYKKFECPREY
jgi:hypothetical protein